MIDAEAVVYSLMRRDIDNTVWVSSDIDAGELANFPAVLFTLTGNGQSANGPGLWLFSLTVSVFGDGINEAKNTARTVYDALWAWNSAPEQTVVTEGAEILGWVANIDDIDIFSRLGSAQIAGRNVTQYAGTFSLALRN